MAAPARAQNSPNGASACLCLRPRTIRKGRLAPGIRGRAAAIGLDRGPQRADRYPLAWGDAADARKSAEELVALAPDVIFASASANVAALQQITRSVPIVFANVIDPVGAGFVASLARPGGNTTGFSSFEYSLSGKWLELLKEIAPNVTRIAVLRDPALAAGIGQFAAIQAITPPSFGVELTTIDGRDPSEIERAITAFAREPNGGLIVTGSPSAVTHRNLIIALATAVPPAERLCVPILPDEWGPCLLRA